MQRRKRSADKAAKTSARDVLKNWNEYYVKNDFGIGVQCSKCQKWRITYKYQEKKDVPKEWTCFMWEIDKSKTGNCSIPSDLTEEDFAEEDYPPGTLVWAKVRTFPWWPGMIEDCPDSQQFYGVDEKDIEHYHVNFLGHEASREWVEVWNIKEYFGSTENPNKKRKITKRLVEAIKEADEALKLPIKERLQKYSFAVRYKGPWLKIKDKEDISLPPACPSNKKVAKFAELKLGANKPKEGDKHQAPTARRRASKSCEKESVDEKVGQSSASACQGEEENQRTGVDTTKEINNEKYQQSSGNNGVSNHDIGVAEECRVGLLTEGNDNQSNDNRAPGSEEDDELDMILDEDTEEVQEAAEIILEEESEGMSNPYDPQDKTIYNVSQMREIAQVYANLLNHPNFQGLLYPFHKKNPVLRDDDNIFI